MWPLISIALTTTDNHHEYTYSQSLLNYVYMYEIMGLLLSKVTYLSGVTRER
jgi:hypothetical protein